jgi:hypothetical protein
MATLRIPVAKFNPFHDSLGQFTGPRGTGGRFVDSPKMHPATRERYAPKADMPKAELYGVYHSPKTGKHRPVYSHVDERLGPPGSMWGHETVGGRAGYTPSPTQPGWSYTPSGGWKGPGGMSVAEAWAKAGSQAGAVRDPDKLRAAPAAAAKPATTVAAPRAPAVVRGATVYQVDAVPAGRRKAVTDHLEALGRTYPEVYRRQVMMVRTEPLSAGVVASYSSTKRVMRLNPDWYVKGREFASLERGGYSPKGTGTPEGVISHEFGHAVQHHLQTFHPGVYERFMAVNGPELRRVSGYARTSDDEAFGEAFAALHHSPTKAPVVLALGAMLDATYGAPR